jgi:hypothetical protein
MFIDIGLDESWKKLELESAKRNMHNQLIPEDNVACNKLIFWIDSLFIYDDSQHNFN